MQQKRQQHCECLQKLLGARVPSSLRHSFGHGSSWTHESEDARRSCFERSTSTAEQKRLKESGASFARATMAGEVVLLLTSDIIPLK
mmetsp:Transcript_110624/g.214208  ORF Transcript_110624/g.214208 Transcript_110624/m.214208 type:complete len:87 (-) Transcript_110624:779-1039(-)